MKTLATLAVRRRQYYTKFSRRLAKMAADAARRQTIYVLTAALSLD